MRYESGVWAYGRDGFVSVDADCWLFFDLALAGGEGCPRCAASDVMPAQARKPFTSLVALPLKGPNPPFISAWSQR